MGRLRVVGINEETAKLSDFDLFWECYPKRKAKLDAVKAWRQTESVRPAIEQVLAAVEAMNKEHDWQRDPQGQYLPFPASWLRAGRWDDE